MVGIHQSRPCKRQVSSCVTLAKLDEKVFRATKLDSTFEWYEDENAAILTFHSADRKQCKETLCVSLPSDAYLG